MSNQTTDFGRILSCDDMFHAVVHKYLNIQCLELEIRTSVCYSIKYWLGHMSDQSGNCTGQHQKWSDIRLLFHALYVVCMYLCGYIFSCTTIVQRYFRAVAAG